MNPEDESIKLLAMRMQQQLSLSREKTITPQNIQHYVSSAILHRERPLPDTSPSEDNTLYQTIYEKLQNGQKLTEEEAGSLRQKDPESYKKAKSIERENDDYWQKLQNCRTKEDVQRAEEAYRQLKRMGLSLTENNTLLPAKEKITYTLFKDAKISAAHNITSRFMNSEDYKRLPTDAEYIEKTKERPPRIAYRELTESVEAQHIRGKYEYEKVLRTMNTEGLTEPEIPLFNGKI